MSSHATPVPMTSTACGPLSGVAEVPGDKSISHRSLILGAMCIGETTISGLLEGDDVLDTAKAMQAFGAELIEHGRDFQEALEHAMTLAGENGVTLVPSFDMSLAKGVASYALELLYAAPDLNTVYVPIGLGSGICGLISARDALGLRWIPGEIAALAGVFAQVEELFLPGVVKPDIFLQPVGDILHAMLKGITGRVLPLHEVPPALASIARQL